MIISFNDLDIVWIITADILQIQFDLRPFFAGQSEHSFFTQVFLDLLLIAIFWIMIYDYIGGIDNTVDGLIQRLVYPVRKLQVLVTKQVGIISADLVKYIFFESTMRTDFTGGMKDIITQIIARRCLL